MDDEPSELDELQANYKVAVENWISAIRKEEALASVNHSVTEIDQWEKIRCAGNQRRVLDK